MKQILDAILDPSSEPADFATMPLPEAYRAVTLHRDEEHMFDGLDTRERDPRKSLHLEEVPVPELGLGEALVAVMASSVNYNTVWSSIFSPMSTFAFLRRYGKLSQLTARHDLPYHVVGSDMSGVVLRTGPGVNAWKPGEEVVAHCLSVELESSDGHNDTMLDPEQRIWGFETNFGGLAELAIVKTNQLMPKPKHLTWEEAATPGLVNSTAFRQLISDNGAAMKQGHNVLIWGASGGLGAYATQYALAGGAIPICVVSSEHKAELCRAVDLLRRVPSILGGQERGGEDPTRFLAAPVDDEIVVGLAERVDSFGVRRERYVHDHHGRDHQHLVDPHQVHLAQPRARVDRAIVVHVRFLLRSQRHGVELAHDLLVHLRPGDADGVVPGEVRVAASHDRRVAVEPSLRVATPVGIAHQLLLGVRDVVPDLLRVVDVRVAVKDRIRLRETVHDPP